MTADRYTKLMLTTVAGSLLVLALTAGRQAPERVQWEHLLIASVGATDIHDTANKQGEEGWEFAGCWASAVPDSTPQRNGRTLYFCILKRPKM